MQLPAASSIEQVSETLALLERSLAEGTDPLRIDASALRNFDTSTLALLLEAQRRAKVQGRAIEVTGAPSKLIELARLYGIEDLLRLGSPDATPGGAESMGAKPGGADSMGATPGGAA